jgi:hypothetical protein
MWRRSQRKYCRTSVNSVTDQVVPSRILFCPRSLKPRRRPMYRYDKPDPTTESVGWMWMFIAVVLVVILPYVLVLSCSSII